MRRRQTLFSWITQNFLSNLFQIRLIKVWGLAALQLKSARSQTEARCSTIAFRNAIFRDPPKLTCNGRFPERVSFLFRPTCLLQEPCATRLCNIAVRGGNMLTANATRMKTERISKLNLGRVVQAPTHNPNNKRATITSCAHGHFFVTVRTF